MGNSGELSNLIDFLGKLAGCSVLFLGVAFCAGYFYSSAYLEFFGARWFLSGFTFIEFVVRGIWNAVYGAIGLLVLVVVTQSSVVTEKHLLWMARIVCYPFFAIFAVIIFYDEYSNGAWGSVYKSYWLMSWTLMSLVVAAANCMHPVSSGYVIFKIFNVVLFSVLCYSVLVGFPIFNAQEDAQELANNNRAKMMKAYKEGFAEVHFVVDSANGKILLLNKDTSLMVVEPTDGWRIAKSIR
ncbi:hypothetical protein [Pseudomonas sp. A014]|uniref:hypothetical protein n=1 Tax=Pseudomonas sp. A014 TaxID=3458058 RepID=UPI00403536C7